MKKFLAVILSVYVALVVLMPKKQILWTAINKADQSLEVSIEQSSDYGIFQDLNGINIGYDGIKIANIDNVKIFPFIFYNYANISNIELLDSLKSMLNVVILKSSITYFVLNPMKLKINADTTIGKVEGSFDLSTSKLKIFLTPNKEFNSFKYKSYLKKQKGGYSYESIIR